VQGRGQLVFSAFKRPAGYQQHGASVVHDSRTLARRWSGFAHPISLHAYTVSRAFLSFALVAPACRKWRQPLRLSARILSAARRQHVHRAPHKSSSARRTCTFRCANCSYTTFPLNAITRWRYSSIFCEAIILPSATLARQFFTPRAGALHQIRQPIQIQLISGIIAIFKRLGNYSALVQYGPKNIFVQNN